MKKVVFLCLVIAVGYAVFQDWSANNEPVEYITPEGTAERAAEDIIRDVFGARIHRFSEESSMPTVASIRSIKQVDGTVALDMRVHLYGSTGHGFLISLLSNSKKLFPKLIADEKLNGYNEFRLYGSLLMQDRNGNRSEDWVSKVFFTRKAAQEIAWDETDDIHLHFLLTNKNDGKNCTYWVHGGILSKIAWLNMK